MILSRRVVLRLFGALAAMSTLPFGRAIARVAAARPETKAAALLALLPSPESAAVVGREYLRLTPDEADVARLCDLLWPAADGTRGRIAERLAQQQREDFAEDRVVRLRGWILARTEARLCALAALSRHESRDLIS